MQFLVVNNVNKVELLLENIQSKLDLDNIIKNINFSTKFYSCLLNSTQINGINRELEQEQTGIIKFLRYAKI